MKMRDKKNLSQTIRIKQFSIPYYSGMILTTQKEVIKNIEDITDAIQKRRKIHFNYWKYNIDKKSKHRYHI